MRRFKYTVIDPDTQEQAYTSSQTDLGLLVREERHQFGDDAGLYDALDHLVAAVGEVAQRPHRVHQDRDVRVVDQHVQRRHQLADCLLRGWRVPVPTQVHQHLGRAEGMGIGELKRETT